MRATDASMHEIHSERAPNEGIPELRNSSFSDVQQHRRIENISNVRACVFLRNPSVESVSGHHTTPWRQRRSAIEASNIQDVHVQHFEPPEATTVGHRGSKKPTPSMVEGFNPLEATTVGHRGSKNPAHSICEDFEPPHPMAVRHGGLKNSGPSFLRFRTAGDNDVRP